MRIGNISVLPSLAKTFCTHFFWITATIICALDCEASTAWVSSGALISPASTKKGSAFKTLVWFPGGSWAEIKPTIAAGTTISVSSHAGSLLRMSLPRRSTLPWRSKIVHSQLSWFASQAAGIIILSVVNGIFSKAVLANRFHHVLEALRRVLYSFQIAFG